VSYPQQYYGGGYGPPPLGPPPRDRRVIWIALSIAVVVVVAGIGAAFALTGTSSKQSPLAGGSASAPLSQSAATSFSASAQFPSQTSSAPVGFPSAASTTADATSPVASGSSGAAVDACRPGDSADLTAVQLTTVVSFLHAGETNDYAESVIKQCTTSAARSQIKALYGKSFGFPGTDRTGGDNNGPTARYVLKADSGGKATMTLTLESDKRYICTSVSYTR
jgi:FlaG/FlaF family flagellin (archaellin)